MIELDPELKARVLEFVHKRERVTVEDVRRKFFPGDISRPYLYLDALTADCDLLVSSFGDGPTTWLPFRSAEEIAKTRRPVDSRPQEIRKKPRTVSQSQVKRAHEITHAYCDHPLTRTESRRCLETMGKEKLLELTREKRGLPPQPQLLDAKPKKHVGCVHPNTPLENGRCDRGYYIQGTMERTPSVAQILKSLNPKPAPKPERQPRRDPEEARAQVLQWLKEQTEKHRTGQVGCLPTTTDVARAVFPKGASAIIGRDGVVTSGGVVQGSTVLADKYLSLLESEGLVQRHKMIHGIPMVFWSAVEKPTGEPIPPGRLDYYS